VITLKTMLESRWALKSERVVNDCFDQGQHVVEAVAIQVVDANGAVLETVRGLENLNPLLIEHLVAAHNRMIAT
jgi:hypothetical protein